MERDKHWPHKHIHKNDGAIDYATEEYDWIFDFANIYYVKGGLPKKHLVHSSVEFHVTRYILPPNLKSISQKLTENGGRQVFARGKEHSLKKVIGPKNRVEDNYDPKKHIYSVKPLNMYHFFAILPSPVCFFLKPTKSQLSKNPNFLTYTLN